MGNTNKRPKINVLLLIFLSCFYIFPGVIYAMSVVKKQKAFDAEQEKQRAAALATPTTKPQVEIKRQCAQTPKFTARLTRTGSETAQTSISYCDVGDEVEIEFDYDKNLYECISGDTLGYLPEKYNDDDFDDFCVKITKIIENDETGKYSVEVGFYPYCADNVTLINFPVYTKIAGVTYNGRQDNLAQSRQNDDLLIKHSPLDKYPENTLIFNQRTGRELGCINKDLAASLLSKFDKGFVLAGVIKDITGGEDNKTIYGCNIEIIGLAE